MSPRLCEAFSLALTCSSQGIKTFCEFSEQITFGHGSDIARRYAVVN